MKRKRLPAEIFPEEPLESVGTWLAGPVFGPAGLSTVTLDRSGSEFWREYSAGRRAPRISVQYSTSSQAQSKNF